MIWYLANMRFPTEMAHGKHVREMLNALVEHGPATLLVTNRATQGTPAEFGLSPQVRVVRVPVPDIFRFAYGFHIESVCFAVLSGLYVAWHAKQGDRAVARDYLCAAIPALRGIPTGWESHGGQWNAAIRFVLACGARIIAITHGAKDLYMSYGVAPGRIIVAPDGVDLSRYRDLPGRDEARRKIGLPLDRRIAVYNGHLHTWKGAGTAAEAALLLPPEYMCVFMGGTDKDIEAFKKQYGHDGRISIIGRKDDGERPLYLRAADAVLLPNSAKEEVSVKYTSPLKLFGYMAAGAPIVASDLPSIREVLSDDMAYFAVADDPASFARAIQDACENPGEARAKGERVRAEAPRYEWRNRAKAVLDFLK